MSQERMSAPTYALEARQLSVLLGGQKVLEVPSLEVLPSEVLVVIGPNGSGKTTLLLCLASLLRPATGNIFYQGQPVGNGSELLRLRRRFAVVFQEPLLLDATVWDNVTLGMRLRGVKREGIKRRTQKWLERFGIAALAQRQARTLSGGEAKRVSLARAFVLQPEVIFLDEPFAALDSPTRQALIEDFGSVLQETRVSTVMVTHDRNEALVLASRVAVLIGGHIRQVGTPEEVFTYPVDEEVASFVEAGNIIHGVVDSQDGGLTSINVGGQKLDAVSQLTPGTTVTLLLRYEDVTISVPASNSPPTSARNHLIGRVAKIFPVGSQIRVTVDCGFPLVSLVTRQSFSDLSLGEGKQVIAGFKASALHIVRRQARKE